MINKRDRLSKYYLVSLTGCWEWQYAKTKKGYGRITYLGKKYIASRLFYELYRGKIPLRKTVDHLCINTSCVNPDHLELVSLADNIRRGSQTKLTIDNVSEIRSLYTAGRMTQKELGKRFGIDQTNISYIVNRKTWNH